MTGESGTGKSYLAQLMHEYAIARALLSPDAPFISFNCAPVCEQSRTAGGESFWLCEGRVYRRAGDRPGAFEATDGGMLFLDEVHRLSMKRREKLFTARSWVKFIG